MIALLAMVGQSDSRLPEEPPLHIIPTLLAAFAGAGLFELLRGTCRCNRWGDGGSRGR